MGHEAWGKSSILRPQALTNFTKMAKIKTALISVYDKKGIVDFCSILHKKRISIISSGGTAKVLKEAGIPVTDVEKITGFPEMLDGRIKTLHPKIHGGLLAVRSNKAHMKALKEKKIEPIDLVAVNLYPFEERLREGASDADLIENIDIGGPTLIRAAAKNYKDVSIITNPEHYTNIAKDIDKSGTVSEKTNEWLAAEAFNYVAHYDGLIDRYFEQIRNHNYFPKYINLTYEKREDLRYGENPSQKAAVYRSCLSKGGLGNEVQLQGKQLSYNNLLDMDAAWGLVNEFSEPAIVIVKHTNPCGVAVADNLKEAFKRAYSCDSLSAFGGIVAANKEIAEDLATELSALFLEEIIAPSYTNEALKILQKKEKVRVIKAEKRTNKFKLPQLNYRDISAGLVVQTPNDEEIDQKKLKVATKIKPTQEQLRDLVFAWKVCKHVKSNAVVFAKDLQTVGIGAGQMSRVDSTKIASYKSNGKSFGSVMASDAFFPFRDAVDAAADAGVKAIIQPGGSIKDNEVIQAANERGVAMVLSGLRTFKH